MYIARRCRQLVWSLRAARCWCGGSIQRQISYPSRHHPPASRPVYESHGCQIDERTEAVPGPITSARNGVVAQLPGPLYLGPKLACDGYHDAQRVLLQSSCVRSIRSRSISDTKPVYNRWTNLSGYAGSRAPRFVEQTGVIYRPWRLIHWVTFTRRCLLPLEASQMPPSI